MRLLPPMRIVVLIVLAATPQALVAWLQNGQAPVMAIQGMTYMHSQAQKVLKVASNYAT